MEIVIKKATFEQFYNYISNGREKYIAFSDETVGYLYKYISDLEVASNTQFTIDISRLDERFVVMTDDEAEKKYPVQDDLHKHVVKFFPFRVLIDTEPHKTDSI